MKIRKVLTLILIVVIIIIAGAWRQVAFVNTNAQIALLTGVISNSGLVNSMSFISAWELSTLVRFKWALTISFSLFFLVISAWTLWIVFRNKKVLAWLIYVYASIFVLAGLFFLLGKFIDSFEIGYTLSRKCMGALQSPFPLMMLFPAVALIQGQSTEKKNRFDKSSF